MNPMFGEGSAATRTSSVRPAPEDEKYKSVTWETCDRSRENVINLIRSSKEILDNNPGIKSQMASLPASSVAGSQLKIKTHSLAPWYVPPVSQELAPEQSGGKSRGKRSERPSTPRELRVAEGSTSATLVLHKVEDLMCRT